MYQPFLGDGIVITPKLDIDLFVLKTIEVETQMFVSSLQGLGKKIQNYMQSFIIANTKRHPSTGTLAKSINLVIEPGKETIFIGIGDMDILQKEFPGWYVVNYGKMITGQPYIPPSSVGSFNGSAPDFQYVGFGNERFKKDGKYMVRPTESIRPMNYIENSRAYADIEFEKIFEHFKEDYRKYVNSL